MAMPSSASPINRLTTNDAVAGIDDDATGAPPVSARVAAITAIRHATHAPRNAPPLRTPRSVLSTRMNPMIGRGSMAMASPSGTRSFKGASSTPTPGARLHPKGMTTPLAAYSGYASAKWGTESSLTLARASAARTSASRANTEAQTNHNFDGTPFDAWFSAFAAGNEPAMAIAEKRFRPEFEVAFTAWRATSPETNPNAPAGPTYMPEYKQPEKEQAVELDAKADELYAEGAKAGGTADDYVRTTVFLASVLLLVGISGHSRVRSARYGLVAVGAGILVLAVTLLLLAPKPPLQRPRWTYAVAVSAERPKPQPALLPVGGRW